MAFCLALLAQKYPDLVLLVTRWNQLPAPLRAGILAMVRAAPRELPRAHEPADAMFKTALNSGRFAELISYDADAGYVAVQACNLHV